jgi:uncharacterized membrane protein YeiH
MNLLYWFDLAGVAVFAISGALMAGKHHLDIVGIIVLAALTAIGGGTLRDFVLGNTPVFWINDPGYLYVILFASILTFFVAPPLGVRANAVFLIADACGLALFTVIGTQKALLFGASYEAAIIMGTMTGVAGGMMRDSLCGEIPIVLRKEIYAIACVLGGSIYCLGYHYGLDENINITLSFGCAVILRLIAIWFHISLPTLRLRA